jgi:hypothetical protein
MGIEALRGACDDGSEARLGVLGGYPHPGCFGKRGRKLLKTKAGGWKKKAKRLQVIEKARVKAGAGGSVSEVSSR